MSNYKFNNGYIYRNGFRVSMPCVVVTLNEMQQKLEAYTKELPSFKATRENLEKIAKDAQGDFVEVEQEGEKWTHEYGCANIKCRILATDENECWVLTEYGNKVTEHIDELKPIKPTITKAEREKCAALAGYFNINPVEFDEYMEKYDSAEGPAND